MASPAEKIKALSAPIIYCENKHVVSYLRDSSFHALGVEILDRPTFALPSGIRITVGSSGVQRVLKAAGATVNRDEGVDLALIMLKLEEIRRVARQQNMSRDGYFNEFINTFSMIEILTDPKSAARIASGNARFLDCYMILSKGTEVIVDSVHGSYGGILENFQIVQGMFGSYGSCTISVIMATKDGRKSVQTNASFSPFDGEISISKLAVRPITAAEKETLTVRGKIFDEYTKGAIMSSYIGNLGVPTWMGEGNLRADGRMMFDMVSFAQMEPDMNNRIMRQFGVDEDDNDVTPGDNSIAPDALWRTFNRLPAFSMRLKRWGWATVQGISPVLWRDDAFSKLVLDSDTKEMIFHLVQNYNTSFTDFIEGKSGGIVFLLHGPTGQGKTLTAEAVAETLHRPLYSVSMGELGTDPESMETNLRQILDLAHQWNAVLLLDEADIFMEARDSNNVERNAMVSIFLRLLEYHSGVMFLTTNRVKSFDPAFFSRISVPIHYKPLQAADREKIWINILDSAKVDHSVLDIPSLAEYEVNGRNVKTVVRLAQTMGPITQASIVKVLKTTAQFNKTVSDLHNAEYDTGAGLDE